MDKYKYSYLDEKGIYCYKDSDVLITKLNIQDEQTFYNGYAFDWSKISADDNIIASYESVNGNNEKLREIISKIIYKI